MLQGTGSAGKGIVVHRELLPCADLVLVLEDPEIKTEEGETRACGTGHLVFKSPRPGVREVTSKRFAFRSPLGPIEFDEIRWYLEDYFRWPAGVFHQRAKKVEESLEKMGKALYDAVFHQPEAGEAVSGWKGCSEECDLRFSVMVDRDPRPGATGDEIAAAGLGAAGVLAIPWELLHDGETWLFNGAHPVAIRRQLPNRKSLVQYRRLRYPGKSPPADPAGIAGIPGDYCCGQHGIPYAG